MTEAVAPAGFADLWSADREAQNAAYLRFLDETSRPVPWAPVVWDEVVDRLDDGDNHNRSIASQMLARLAQSEPDGRILEDLERLVDVTHDERFVTARHCLQSLWWVGRAGPQARSTLIDALERRFDEAVEDRNTTLIRFDIVESLRRIHDDTGSEEARLAALELIDREEDPKYRTKYAKVWRDHLTGRA